MRKLHHSKKKIILRFSIMIVMFLLILVACVIVRPAFNKQRIITEFNRIYDEAELFKQMKFLGVPSCQNPCDNWVMQEIISEVKPDYIIETGTYKGGTSLYYATILEKVNKRGRVITVDINPKLKHEIKQAAGYKVFRDHVDVIRGDSASTETIKKISKIVNRVSNPKVLVTLDSLHTKEHVSKELALYSPFVSKGSYIVVQDTLAFGLMETIKQFLKENKNFKIDYSREKFMLTYYPSGYLKRVK